MRTPVHGRGVPPRQVQLRKHVGRVVNVGCIKFARERSIPR